MGGASTLNTVTGVSNTVCTAAGYIHTFVVRVCLLLESSGRHCVTEYPVLGEDGTVVSDAISTRAV